MRTRQDIKALALDALRLRRGACAGVCLLSVVFTVLLGALTMGVGILAAPIFLVGACAFFLKSYRGDLPRVSDWLNMCFADVLHYIGGMLYMALWILIWGALSIVAAIVLDLAKAPDELSIPLMLVAFSPGVVKSYSYCLTPYILADCPGISTREAIKVSSAMTEGYRADIFVTQISFIGWAFLSVLTLHIVGIVHAYPYFQLTMAGVYDELKERAIDEGLFTREGLNGRA